MSWIEKLTGDLGDKKKYLAYKGRIKALPEPYRTAANAFERYFMHNGGIPDGDPTMMNAMLSDFADLWERAAADETPVRDIVGGDPVGFADDFAAAYTGKRWVDKERARLADTIDRLDAGGQP
jgi:DNA-binding ferritin-like protein (Dps family)